MRCLTSGTIQWTFESLQSAPYSVLVNLVTFVPNADLFSSCVMLHLQPQYYYHILMRNVFFNTPGLETTFQLYLAIQGQQEPKESKEGIQYVIKKLWLCAIISTMSLREVSFSRYSFVSLSR